MITIEAIDRSGGNYNYEKCEKSANGKHFRWD